MIVYLEIGIWRGLTAINNTPHLHSMEWAQNVPTKHTNTSDISIRYPCCQKSPNFISKD